MKVQELRIGNHVMASAFGGKGDPQWIRGTGKVHSIQSETELKVGDGISWTIDGISGIPLTEEWLVRLGFVEVPVYHPIPNNRAFERGCIHVKIYHSHKIKRIWYKDIVIDNDYFFVHQLQNLYFALTGEELEVKP